MGFLRGGATICDFIYYLMEIYHEPCKWNSEQDHQERSIFQTHNGVCMVCLAAGGAGKQRMQAYRLAGMMMMRSRRNTKVNSSPKPSNGERPHLNARPQPHKR